MPEKITAEEVLEGLEAICSQRPNYIGPARFRGSGGVRDESVVSALLDQYDVAPQVAQFRFTEQARALLASLQEWNDAGYRWGTLPAKARASLTRRPVQRPQSS